MPKASSQMGIFAQQVPEEMPLKHLTACWGLSLILMGCFPDEFLSHQLAAESDVKNINPNFFLAHGSVRALWRFPWYRGLPAFGGAGLVILPICSTSSSLRCSTHAPWLSAPLPYLQASCLAAPLLSCRTYPLWHLPWGSSGSLVLRSKSWNKWAALKQPGEKKKQKEESTKEAPIASSIAKIIRKKLWVESSPNHEIALKIVIVKHRHILVLFTSCLTIYESSL